MTHARCPFCGGADLEVVTQGRFEARSKRVHCRDEGCWTFGPIAKFSVREDGAEEAAVAKAWELWDR